MNHAPRTLAATLALAALWLLPAIARAQLHASDIIVMIQSGRLTTSAVSSEGSLVPQRLFVGTLNSGGSASDPGFDSNPAFLPEGAGLPPNASLGFEFTAAVRVWDGSDFDQTGPQIVRGRFGPLIAFSPAADPATPAAGFAVSASSEGVYHNHFTWTTFNPGNPPTQTSTAGLYLVALRLTAPDTAQASDTFYLLLNRQSSAQLDSAIDWITTNLLTPVQPACPEDFNRDGFRNLDDLSDFITDFYVQPPIPAGLQPFAPTYPDTAVGFGSPCPLAPDAPAPFAADAFRALGYRAGFSIDGSNTCPQAPDQPFPNLDNLADYITAFYASNCPL